MAIVRRANVILTVKDDQVERFVDQGYDVVDVTGNIIRKSMPKDVASLTKAYHEHEAEIAKLKAEIAKLSAPKEKPVQKSEPKEEEVPKEQAKSSKKK